MNKNPQWYTAFIPILGIQVVLEQLSKMASDYQHHNTIYRHPSLVILNSGNHWLLANVQFDKRQITMWDPYPQNHQIESVTKLLRKLNITWKVQRIGLGTQEITDSNTCGYHVLMWIKQILQPTQLITPQWKPQMYSSKDWVETIYNLLHFDLGQIHITQTNNTHNKPILHQTDFQKKRNGSAAYRRERYRHWISSIGHKS